MNPKEKSASVRTGKMLSASGVWIVRCMRDGCGFVERIFLQELAPAPPCRRCLNPAWCRFLHAPAPIELPAPPAVAPAAIAAPTESVHSARGAAAAEASATIVISTPKEEKPVAEKAAADPADKKKIEGPPIAEVEPSLFEQLKATGGHQTPANTSRAARK